MNNRHHRPPARQHATVMALVATVATALAGILTLVLGPAPAATAASGPPALAAPPVANPRPSTPPAALAAPERSGPRPTQRPLQPQRVGHVRPVTGPGRASVATAALPTGRQVITRDRAAQLLEDVTPTLVNITARQPDGTTAAGTGIVLRSDGIKITNDHVIAGAAAPTARSLATGRSYRAAVLAVDEIHDIAVIALRGAHDLPVGRFGNSARLRIGDVASVGNAWGLGARPRINVGPVTRLSARIASTTHPQVCDADTDC